MSSITKVYGGLATITFHSRGKAHYYTVDIPSRKMYRLFQPSVTGIIGKLDKSGALVPWAVDRMTARILELVKLSGETEAIDLGMLASIIDHAKDTWREEKQEAADIGSVVHRVLEQELNARAGLCEHPVLPVKVDPVLAPDLTPEMLRKANASIMAGFQFFDEHHIEIVQAEGVRWSPKYGYLGTGDLVARVDGMLTMLDYKSGKRLYPTVWLQLAAYQVAYQEEFPDQQIEQRLAVNVGRDGVLETKTRDNATLKSDFAAFLGLLRAWRWDTENTDYKPKPAPAIVGVLQ